MIALVADINIQGHVVRLVNRMQGKDWRDFWDYLKLRLMTFSEVELSPDDTDATIWRCCQERQLYLITNNRNDDGPESLEATIRERNGPMSLPVFTIGDADRLLADSDYANRVVDRLLQYLLDRENIHGTGRLYLP